jgi:hypothetical protein
LRAASSKELLLEPSLALNLAESADIIHVPFLRIDLDFVGWFDTIVHFVE